MPAAFPIRTSFVLLVCFLSAPAPSHAQSGADELVLSLGYARPYVVEPPAVRDAFRGSWGMAASALYAFRSQLEVGIHYDLLRLARQDLAEGASGGDATVQAISAVGGFASARELPVQVFVHLGPTLVLSTDQAVRGTVRQDPVSGSGPGATGRIGIRVPLGNDVFASAGGSALVFSTDGFSRTLSTLHLGLTLRSPVPSPTP